MQRRSHSNDEGWLLSYADLITNLLIFFALMLAAAEMNTAKMQQISQSISGVEQPASLSSIQEQIDAQIVEEGLEGTVRTELTDDGLRLSLDSGIVFDSGSAQIRPEQADVIERMLQTLVPYGARYAFAIEGHTDSTPLTGDRTNWELSTDRANALRARLEQVGIDPGRIRVEGYADTVPLPEADLEGLTEDERLARHRRVVVRIY